MDKIIGFIGLGVMGKPMCTHILDAGYDCAIFSRTKSKAEDLLQKGALWCSSPKEVAKKSDIIFTIVGYPADVKEVYMGKNGILDGISSGNIIIDMTTSEPSLAVQIYRLSHEKGVASIDAPVSGGDVGAKNGTLAIMCGGDEKDFKQVMPILNLMGANIAYMGKAGSGQHTKMSNQILIASTMIGVVESLLYAHKAGNNLDAVIDVIGKGAASCWSINNLGRRITQRNFKPGFFIKHFIKDMSIALSEAKRMNLSLPGLSLVHQFYTAASAQGLENLGTQGLYKVFETLNGIQ